MITLSVCFKILTLSRVTLLNKVNLVKPCYLANLCYWTGVIYKNSCFGWPVLNLKKHARGLRSHSYRGCESHSGIEKMASAMASLL